MKAHPVHMMNAAQCQATIDHWKLEQAIRLELQVRLQEATLSMSAADIHYCSDESWYD